MRGENDADDAAGGFGPGTSPRARGKPRRAGAFTMPLGNIPACAGKTRDQGCCVPGGREHPRVRGENPSSAPEMSSKSGTSPRARGKLSIGMGGHMGARNIPACAGKTVICR